jgi:hypothetical protein
MTLHLHLILKISEDFYGSLVHTISAQGSFKNVKEFGLRAQILKDFEITVGLKGVCKASKSV